MNLIDDLIKQGWLKTPRIIDAFRKIKRKDFLVVKTENKETLAELNQAMSIGYEQTISQPLTVAFMLELLQPVYGDKILDIGSGSGWTSALLARIVNSKELKSKQKTQKLKPAGKVIAIELVPELKEFGEKNVAKYGYVKNGIVEFICSDGSKGCPNIKTRKEFAEGFDKILCSAEAKELPQA
ncbi:protein-L-isoaspartate O-methyltransferase, partial [Patescibacteria group bacterium]|nr:protein-L-isoaspartate O-methyltransferase [Patescibacteria group bacterium]